MEPIKNLISRKSKQIFDPGFGTKDLGNSGRILGKDGNVRVQKTGVSFWQSKQLYLRLIAMPSWQFALSLLTAYILVNVLFAGLYIISGAEINGSSTENSTDTFFQYLYFSTQTLTTVGFGHLSPANNIASVLAALESFIGLLLFALATGLLYARFARPKANIKFSENGLIAPYQDGTAFMFRLANVASSQLAEVSVSVAFSILDESKSKRQYYSLELERSSISLLASNWTIVHPIHEQSPFHKFQKSEMHDRFAEVIIILTAFETEGNTQIHTRTSYKAEEFVFNAKFQPMLFEDPDNGQLMHVGLLNAHKSVEK